MGLFSREPRRSATLSAVDWWSLGVGFTPTIRGESNYLPQLRALLRRDARWVATLVREPLNEYDPNAVAVHIEGTCVGHLAKEDAAELAARLDSLLRRNVVVTCNVTLYGGTDDKPNIGVFMDD